jgi:phytoene desaturase
LLKNNMSKKIPTAIVIGSGIGGIAVAAQLSRRGFKVTVFEKNSQPGGRCNQMVKNGHSFDTGPTFLLLPDTYRETFAALGEKMEDHLKLHRIEPTYQVHFKNGTRLNLTSDLFEMQKQLEEIEPGSFSGYLRYLDEGDRNNRLSMKHILEKPFYKFYEYINPQNLLLLLKVKALTRHYQNASHYFKSDSLRAGFTFQDSYISVSPYKAMATFSMLQYTELVNGVFLPEGGMYAVIKALTKIAKKLKVDFHFNSPVEKINCEGRHARGVTLANGRKYFADIVISNADLPYVYNRLLQKGREAKKLLNKKYSCSCLMFLWAIKKQYPQLSTHNLFLAGDYKKSFSAVLEDLDLPKDASFYVHSPRHINPRSAPKGQDSLVVIFPVGHIDNVKPQNWADLQKRAKAVALKRLAEIGIKDIEKQIKFEVKIDPTQWKDYYNLTNGSILGLNHNFFQMGYFRPQNKHKKYKNLYFVGADTHPGSGLPAVLLSARHVTKRILKELQYTE